MERPIFGGIAEPSNLDRERLLLLDLQQEQAELLDEYGITELAESRLSPQHELNDLTRISVATIKDGSSNSSELVAIQFTTSQTLPGNTGKTAPTIWYVPIARLEGGETHELSGFTSQQVDVALDLIDVLQKAKELRYLPHLSDDLGSIAVKSARS